MLGFQSLVLLGLTAAIPQLRALSRVSTIAFWILSLASYMVYFLASQSSPGFVTNEVTKARFPSDAKKFFEDQTINVSVELTPKASKSIGFSKLKEIPPQQDSNPAAKSENINTERSDHEEEEKESAAKVEQFEKSEEIQITEIRHCTVCKLDQPMRTKHCRDCGKCIATHDHHCPWLGVCIGERNKKIFYCYLQFQLAHLLWALIWVTSKQTFSSISSDNSVLAWLLHNWHRVLLSVLLLLLSTMVGCLLGFHIYLAAVGMTTWEFMSWGRISYLKTMNRAAGSPFSKGLLKNLYSSCVQRLPDYLITWEIAPSANLAF